MPELPEVETMVRGLRPAMEGWKIESVKVHDRFLLQGVTDPSVFEGKVTGARVEKVDRRGKWVVFTMEGAAGIIVIQPRMTGGFWLVIPDRPDHARLSFRMSGPSPLVWFCDTRRLGKIAWHDGPESAEGAFRKSQGPDALEISLSALSDGLKRTDRPIKPALMDQKLLAGIGNIYADEVLFEARIHPERRASGLTSVERARLHESIGKVLRLAIEAEGSTFDKGYRTVLGLEGGFLAQNAMYGREGKPCPGCQGAVVKARIVGLSGRPTHYCPRCQPIRRGRR